MIIIIIILIIIIVNILFNSNLSQLKSRIIIIISTYLCTMYHCLLTVTEILMKRENHVFGQTPSTKDWLRPTKIVNK